MKLFFFLIFASILNPVHQEGSESNSSGPDHTISIGYWFGYSHDSNTLFAKMQNTRFTLTGLEVMHTRLSLNKIDLLFGSTLTLYAKTDFPVNGQSGPRDSRSGIGITPLKIVMPFSNFGKSYPYFTAGAGMMLFEERFPNRDGTLLNATLEAGFGYLLNITSNIDLDFTYRYHHLSNAKTGDVNPGIDSNLFTATIRISP